MNRFHAGLVAAFGLVSAATAWADPPQIQGTSPFGVKKGEATEVTISGTNLAGNPQLIAPFAFQVEPIPAPSPNPAAWKLKLTVPAETPLGVYPIRVKTDDGLSNSFLFSVGQLPRVAEAEDNSTFETAQAISTPAVVEGQSAGNDVDFFRFPGKKGQQIVIDAQCARIGSGVDPTIRLMTAARGFVAAAEDSAGLLTDARLFVTLPEDTDYIVELSDARYQGGGRPVYRLVIGAVPAAEEVFPIGARQGETVGFELRGGTIPGLGVAAATVSAPSLGNVFTLRATETNPTGQVADVESLGSLEVSNVLEVREPSDPAAANVRVGVPVVLNGRIDPVGDEDRFTLAVTPGQALHFEVLASEHGSALDGVLQVLGSNNAVLATADDRVIPTAAGAPALASPDPSLDFNVPAGVSEITLTLRDLEKRGGVGFPYRIVATPVVPTFEVALNDPQVSIPKGGNAIIGVVATRKGYNGPITLTVRNLPPGLSVRPGTIAEGQTLGSLSVSATAEAAFGATRLEVVGEAQGPAGPIVSPAKKVLAFAQQGTFPTKSVTQVGLAAAPALALPVVLDAPATPLEIVHGFGAPLSVKLARTAGADAALAVSALPMPPGFAVPAANLAEKAAEGAVPINAAVEAPLGTSTLALVAKGKFANVERTIALPAVTVNVIRPAALELASAAIELKPGATAELKGKVVRKGPFKEPVTIKVNGLPAGLKADPVTLAPDKAEFTVPVVADAKAAAATAGANVTISFQINKKDYPTPPAPLSVKVVPAK